MKKILCNIVVLCFCNQSLAYNFQKPVIQSASADSSEYYAFLSLNADYMDYSAYQLLEITNNPINDKISSLYLKAQKHYYERSFFKSKKLYQKIIGLRNKYHFSLHSKKLVINSLLKAYELSSSPVKQKKYLKLIRSTYPYINLDDFDIAPSIANKIENLPLLFSNWYIPNNLSKYSYIVINGKHHEIFPDKKIRLPKGEFIISLISNSFHPSTRIITKSKLNKWSPNSLWINSGSCNAPNLKPNKKLKNIYVFFAHNCVIANGRKQKKSAKKITDINSLKPNKKYSSITYKPKNTYKWLKNKWLWIGLGAIATTVAITSGRNKGKKTKTPKQGF